MTHSFEKPFITFLSFFIVYLSYFPLCALALPQSPVGLANGIVNSATDGNVPTPENIFRPGGSQVDDASIRDPNSAFPGFGQGEVSAQMLKDFVLYREYSALTYCPENSDSPGTPILTSPPDTPNGCPNVASISDWTRTVMEFGNLGESDTTGLFVIDHANKKHILSFRGTRSIQNVLVNLQYTLTDTDLCNGCEISEGFWNSWLFGRDYIREGLRRAYMAYPFYQVVVTGHSQGGALASIAAAQLRNDGYTTALYTYGAPRFGNDAVSQYISDQPGGNYRITHTTDPVPRLPPHGEFGHAHISPEYFIKTPDGVPVIPSDITILHGLYNENGNEGSGRATWSAHSHYFSEMTACCPNEATSNPFVTMLLDSL